MITLLDLSFNSTGNFPDHQRTRVFAIVHDLRGHSDRADMFCFAVGEAFANAALHGKPPHTVKVWSEDGTLYVSISDHGEGAHWLCSSMPEPTANHGRGIPIIRQGSTACWWGFVGDAFICRLELGL